MIGDSHAEAIEFILNEELTKNKYNLFRFKTELYLPNFNMVNRKSLKEVNYFNKNNDKITKFLKNEKNLIVLIHHRYAASFLETKFDNEEGGSEFTKPHKKFTEYYFQKEMNYKKKQVARESLIKQGFIDTVNSILDLGHKVILIYPVPEIGFNPVKTISNTLRKNKTNNKSEKFPILSVSYDVFKKRNEKIFKTLNKINHKNLYRIYPHLHFCSTNVINRCITNDEENIYYWDDDHISLYGSKFIVEDIIRKINIIK